jgi:uncharacterized protein (DUF697 family)
MLRYVSRVIEVPFHGDPAAVVERAKAAAAKYGATFTGDHTTGTFAGNGIEGHYRFTDTIVVVTIEKKPDFAPWLLVEGALRKFFESDPTQVVATASEGPPRRERATTIVRKHVLVASGAGLIPIPLADIAAVTGVQVSMLQALTKLYDAQMSRPALENFITALTGGMLARLGASVIKTIPGLGTLLGAASMSILSGASTYAVGKVATDHLERGGELSSVDLAKARRDYDREYASGKEYVEDLKSSKEDTIGKLERLGELRAKGVITEDEFQTQKAKLLNDS